VSYQELRTRYQQHAVAMGDAMKEAGEHIEANSQLDLTDDELLAAIAQIQMMLRTAEYHADRMRVYGKLMESARPKESRCASAVPQCFAPAMHGSLFCRWHRIQSES